MYEFVTKKEIKPIRLIIEEIINLVQKQLRKTRGITFQYSLIGSGKNHLITRIKNGNSGYDFDYNLIVNSKKIPNAEIRKYFFDALQEVIVSRKNLFNKIENSKSVITIKKISSPEKRVIYSCDFAIVHFSKTLEKHYSFIKYDKENKKYVWELRKEFDYIYEKLDYLLKNNVVTQNEIRRAYLELKNKNKIKEKSSFSLFFETINNLYNIYDDE